MREAHCVGNTPQTPARQKCEKPCNIERVLFAHIRVFRNLVVVVVVDFFFLVSSTTSFICVAVMMIAREFNRIACVSCVCRAFEHN